ERLRAAYGTLLDSASAILLVGQLRRGLHGMDMAQLDPQAQAEARGIEDSYEPAVEAARKAQGALMLEGDDEYASAIHGLYLEVRMAFGDLGNMLTDVEETANAG